MLNAILNIFNIFSKIKQLLLQTMIGKWQNLYITAWNVSKYGVFSGLCFPVLGLNRKIDGVNRTRKNSVFRHFSCNVYVCIFTYLNLLLYYYAWSTVIKWRRLDRLHLISWSSSPMRNRNKIKIVNYFFQV